MSEADAAIVADPAFGVARTLRAEIVARLNPDVVSEGAPSVAVAAPVVTPVVTPVAPPMTVASPIRVGAPLPAPKASVGRRPVASKSAGLPIALGVLVIAGGVGLALFASGLMFREPASARVATVVAPTPAVPARASDVVLPAPARPAAVPVVAQPVVAEPRVGAATNVIEWASSRLTHLNVRPRWRASALHVEDAALLRDLGQGIGELWVGKLTGNEDAIFVGGSIDDHDWVKLRGSIKPTGVVWRIYSNRAASADAPAAAAAAAGFSRVRKVRYSADYSGEQFALLRSAR